MHNPPHPGEVLLELYIKPMYKNVHRFSLASKLCKMQIGDIIKGKHGIGMKTAHRLADFFGNDARIWLNLQMEYDIWQYKETGRVSRRPKPPKS